MRRLDLRLRITLAISVVCIAILSALGVTLYMASEGMELALVEQLVAEELDFLILRHAQDPDYIPTPGPNVEYYIVQADADPAMLPPFLRDLGTGHYELDIGKERGERDIIIRQVDGFRYIVVYNIGPYEQREQEFKQLVLVTLAIVMALAIGLGYMLSGFLARQLTLLAQKVSRLRPGEPYESLQKGEQDREVALLARAFDEYHELFFTMIRREQEFTANVSHELRTPLTAIRTSCELLAQDSTLSAKGRSRVSHILQAVNDMTEHTRVLLLLARRESSEQEEFGLRECAEDVLAHFRDEIARKQLACEIEIPPDAMLRGNRQALHLVLNNLVKNAVSYTPSGFIRLGLVGGRLEVADSGPGIPGEQLPLIFNRSFRGGNKMDGLGFGLDIVMRICEWAGWTIAVRSTVGEGSVFSLAFGRSEPRSST